MKPGPVGNLGHDWTEEYEYFHGESQPKAIRSLIHPDKVNATLKDSIMAKINEMLPSKYLKQTDIDQDYIVTIAEVKQVNVAAQDADKDEFKWTVTFREFDKPMVLNSTNIQSLAKACKSDDTDDWTGKEVIVFTDPNVSYGGKVVGGLRIREHKVIQPKAPPGRARQAAPAATNTGFDQMDDDIPF